MVDFDATENVIIDEVPVNDAGKALDYHNKLTGLTLAKHAVVENQEIKDDNESFFKRHKTAIIVCGCCAVGLAALGIVFGGK